MESWVWIVTHNNSTHQVISHHPPLASLIITSLSSQNCYYFNQKKRGPSDYKINYKRAKRQKYLEVGGQLGSERLSEIADGRIQVENSRVLQFLGLVDYGLHHIRMAVAATHRSNSSEPVQIPPALLIEQVLHLAVHYIQLSSPDKTLTLSKSKSKSKS